MHKYEGYLYGNYDSRGGTSFIVAPNREVADWHYNRVTCQTDDETLAYGGAADIDFITKAVLTSAEELDAGELEDNDSWDSIEESCSSGRVWVLGYGKTPEEMTDPMDGVDDEGFFDFSQVPEQETVRLQWIKNDHKQVVSKHLGSGAHYINMEGDNTLATSVTLETWTDCDTKHHITRQAIAVHYAKGVKERSMPVMTGYRACDCEPMPYGPRPEGKATHPRWDDDAYSFVLEFADADGYLNDKTYKTIMNNVK